MLLSCETLWKMDGRPSAFEQNHPCPPQICDRGTAGCKCSWQTDWESANISHNRRWHFSSLDFFTAQSLQEKIHWMQLTRQMVTCFQKCFMIFKYSARQPTLKWSKGSKCHPYECVFAWALIGLLLLSPLQTSARAVAHLTSQVWNMEKAKWGENGWNYAALLICLHKPHSQLRFFIFTAFCGFIFLQT